MLKISKICLNLKTERNRFCNQSIPLFFESEQETHNLLKNTTFFHPFFPLSFCNISFHYSFLWDCPRGRKGHLME